jgi:hypothetical protein
MNDQPQPFASRKLRAAVGWTARVIGTAALGAAAAFGPGALIGALCGLMAAVLHADWGAIGATGVRFAVAGAAAGMLTGAVYGICQIAGPGAGTGNRPRGAGREPRRAPRRASGLPADNALRHPSGNGLLR